MYEENDIAVCRGSTAGAWGDFRLFGNRVRQHPHASKDKVTTMRCRFHAGACKPPCGQQIIIGKVQITMHFPVFHITLFI